MKARKQGNSLTLSILKSFNVREGKEFKAIKWDDGSITFVPEVNPDFSDLASERMTDLFEDSGEKGKENEF